MRCLACDCSLNDKETSRRGLFTGDYLDLCDRCFATIKDDVAATTNPAFDEPVEDDGDDWLDD